MAEISELDQQLKHLSPSLQPEEYVFCHVKSPLLDNLQFNPIGAFYEREGLTLILSKPAADANKLEYSSVLKQITLNVHSSLESAGLTAAVTTALAEKAICANVVAAYYHDHIFVTAEQADLALQVLQNLQQSAV